MFLLLIDRSVGTELDTMKRIGQQGHSLVELLVAMATVRLEIDAQIVEVAAELENYLVVISR